MPETALASPPYSPVAQAGGEPLSRSVCPEAGGQDQGDNDDWFQGDLATYQRQRQPGRRPPRCRRRPAAERPPKSQMTAAKIAPKMIDVSKQLPPRYEREFQRFSIFTVIGWFDRRRAHPPRTTGLHKRTKRTADFSRHEMSGAWTTAIWNR